MRYAERIRQKLTAGLTPSTLDIVDESARHAGHAGAARHPGGAAVEPEGETHFNVRIVSPAFEGRSRVDRQRMVYDLLAEELSERVHALALTTRAPSEIG